ncbi:MAG: YbdK family carboxylate-amine ligase [Solirubrobacterales bacterium]|nr:YbdK family carboxylate-amine ligase [Solirubrobacterales bacterium]
MASDAALEHRFGCGESFSLGVEEELFLVDPVSGRQTNTSAAVLARLGPLDGSVERELHACQVELITDIHMRADAAIRQLGELRRAVLRTGAGILASGTHPTAAEGDAAITDKERYERIHFLLGDAAVTPVGGLHIHVGMPNPETAIRVFNGLRRDLPLLQALAANSPFRHGRDTGLASAREVSLRAWPRSGTPRVMRDYDDFCRMTRLLTRAADVPDYTWFWWKLRPHPRLGTVEIRALDAQTSLRDTAAIVALVHCLARDAADGPPREDPSPELVEEAIFRAARFGVRGELPDAGGAVRPVAEVMAEAVARVEPWADELGCQSELAALPDLLERGGGAGAQRAIFEVAGIEAVARELTAASAAAGT